MSFWKAGTLWNKMVVVNVTIFVKTHIFSKKYTKVIIDC